MSLKYVIMQIACIWNGWVLRFIDYLFKKSMLIVSLKSVEIVMTEDFMADGVFPVSYVIQIGSDKYEES